ncbi:MAG: hypothetical protein ACTSWN_04145 [Promethearchaeota archaeon]
MDRATIKNKNIKLVIANNRKSFPKHKAGYNGIASLKYVGKNWKNKSFNFFVPEYAGINLEHYFDQRSHKRRDFFHPRRYPMKLCTSVKENAVFLEQEPHPPWSIQYKAKFSLEDPYYIDLHLSVTPRHYAIEKSEFLGVFWASYINYPEKLGYYIYGYENEEFKSPSWIYYETPAHGVNSTVCCDPSQKRLNFNNEIQERWLFIVYANCFYERDFPLFFGCNRGLMMLLLFQEHDLLRFVHSPCGAGIKRPAWDFFIVIPKPKVDKDYTIHGRIVFKPFISKNDVLNEYKIYKKNITGNQVENSSM